MVFYKKLFPVVLFFALLSGEDASAGSVPYPGIGDGKKATDVILTLVDGVAVDSKGNLFSQGG
jgi:hypothetical protein